MILNKSSIRLSICLNFSSCKMGIILLNLPHHESLGDWEALRFYSGHSDLRAKATHTIHGLPQERWGPSGLSGTTVSGRLILQGIKPEFVFRGRLVLGNISSLGKLDFPPLSWPWQVLSFDSKPITSCKVKASVLLPLRYSQAISYSIEEGRPSRLFFPSVWLEDLALWVQTPWGFSN